MGSLSVVVGGQYGSEGKGAITAWLGREAWAGGEEVCGVRVAGPNAGHTVIGPVECGQVGGLEREWKLRSVPVLAVSNPEAPLVIAAGSEVDWSVLCAEVEELDAAGYQVAGRLMVDQEATVLTKLHIEAEQDKGMQARLGSTAKGIGAARSARIWREARTVGGESVAISDRRISGGNTPDWMRGFMRSGGHVLIEGTQGYGLGLHAGEYPYSTSSDCRAIDFLAMAGLSPWAPEVRELDVWVVLRTRPIRVAGNSGRLKDETSWGAVGLKEERTTVTNKVRRVGEWDTDLAVRALDANGGDRAKVALTMLDQMYPEIAGATEHRELSRASLQYISDLERAMDHRIDAVGTSPSTVVAL